MDSDIYYIRGDARVNVCRKNIFLVILGPSKLNINPWEVVVNGEENTMRAGYIIVTMDLSVNNK